MALKGCWTCKERRISCDRTAPRCFKCTKSKRECGGYGLRLVWPKAHCSRALAVSKFSKHDDCFTQTDTYHWVNVIPTDIRLHLVTSATMGNAGNNVTKNQLTFPNCPELISMQPGKVTTDDLELINYFESVVVSLLPMIYTDRRRLGRLLVEIALSKRSRSSSAVYHAILALASYYRGDNILEVDRVKRAALRDLYTYVDFSMCQAIDHIAANLVLCVLEMQQTSGQNSAWVGYIGGVKQVINALKSMDPAPGSDGSLILGWVYHFDVMARFSSRHWRTEQIKAVAKELGFSAGGSQTCAVQYILSRISFAHGIANIASHAHPIMRLLGEVSTTAMYSSEPNYCSTEYQRHLNDLRLKLQNADACIYDHDDSAPYDVSYNEQLLDLARLAGLIYLERVSRNFSGYSAKIESWTKQALQMLAKLESCHCPFALFFIGCETDIDEDRIVILNLYAKMENRPHLQSFMEVKGLIQTAWNQQDLAEEGELDYVHKLNLVMSSRDIVPTFM